MSRQIMLVLILAGLLLGACQPRPTPAPLVTDTIAFAFPSADTAYYRALLVKFNQQHPEIGVDLLPRDGGYGDVAWDVRVISRRIVTNPDNPASADFLSLDAFIAQNPTFDRADYYPGTLEAFTDQGKLKALPYGLDPEVMFYNKDLFDQRQVAYPQAGWTRDDFLQKASALSDPAQGVYGYVSDNEHEDAFFFAMQHGGRLADDSGKPTLSDPLTVEAMTWYGRLFHEYRVAPTPDVIGDLYVSSEAYAAAIVSGRTGMWMGPYSNWIGDETVGKYKFRLGAAPLPKDAQPFTLAMFEGYAVSPGAAAPEACWAWITFLSGEMPNRLLPARRSLAESQTYINLTGSEVAQAGRDSLADARLVNRFGGGMGQFGAQEAFFWAVEQIVNGEMTAAQALAQAQIRAEQSQ